MEEKAFIDMIVAWLTSGGVGALISAAIAWLSKALPSFGKWWDTLTEQLKQGLVFFVNALVSVGIYVALAYAGAIAIPTTVMSWIAALFPIIFVQFGINQLVFKQVVKRAQPRRYPVITPDGEF